MSLESCVKGPGPLRSPYSSRPPRFAAASSFPSFSILSRPFPLLPFEIEDRKERTKPCRPSLSAAPRGILCTSSRYRDADLLGTTRIPSPAEKCTPNFSIDRAPPLPLRLAFRSFRLPPGRNGPPAFEHCAQIDQINDRIKPNIQKRMAARREGGDSASWT